MAITKIDGQKVSTGKVGPITQELQDRYWALHDDPRYAYEIHYPVR